VDCAPKKKARKKSTRRGLERKFFGRENQFCRPVRSALENLRRRKDTHDPQGGGQGGRGAFGGKAGEENGMPQKVSLGGS